MQWVALVSLAANAILTRSLCSSPAKNKMVMSCLYKYTRKEGSCQPGPAYLDAAFHEQILCATYGLGDSAHRTKRSHRRTWLTIALLPHVLVKVFVEFAT